jgi:hypothetical protein
LSQCNIDYAYAYTPQDDSVNSFLPYAPSSTSLYSYATPTDSHNVVVDLVSTGASADSNTASIISIAALPPRMTHPHHGLTKFPYYQHLNDVFLVPLFAAMGILLEVAVACLWFRFQPPRPRNGRANRNGLDLPVHVPASGEVVQGGGVYSNSTRITEDVTLCCGHSLR